MSNLQIVNGTALYTANFTVPTTPLTAVTNTSLLTCQSSQFIDNSTNAFAITANGNAQPLPTNPFGMTAWSGYFDGTGDYLTVPSATATTLDADFTIEYFMYRPAAGNNWILTLGDAFLSSGIETYIGTSGTAFNLYSANAVRITSSTLPAVGAWSHVAMVRSGSTVTLYLNGVSLGTWTSSATFSGITYIGAERYNGSITGVFTGYLSNVRIVKGTAVYTSNFTPPTAPLTAISGTQLLTCQSSTFIDNSTNAFTITVNGNSYTLTLNNPFNNPINYTTPPVQAWSTYFDGSGDYITYPSTTAFTFGTGDFTVECWFNASNVTALGVIATTGEPTDFQGVFLSVYNGFTYTLLGNGGSWNTQLTGTIPLKIGQWNHLAVTRSGSTVRVFLNGSPDISGTNSTSLTNSNNRITIGGRSNGSQWFTGYISNLRIQKGIAQYTQPFTPPTAPLSVNNGCVLLTCQSNRFVDNSINNFSASVFGNSLISSLSPFIPTQSWSAASYGGTMFFDGTGDSLSIPGNAAFAFGTGNFTIEAWVYTPATQTQFAAIACNSNNPDGWFFSFSTTNLMTFSNWNVSAMTSSSAVPLGAWTHVAVSRSGTSLRMFFNGQQVASATNSTTYGVAGSTNYIGFNSQTHYFNGYISGLRILKGTALYTGPFVPPVLPLTNISNTSLLLNATNSGIYDATGQNVIETVGNAQVTTAVKKFGESSISFDGSGDYLIMAATQAATAQFGTADFTVEGWFYPTNVTTLQVLIGNRVASTGANNWDMAINASSKINWGTTSTNYLTSSTSVLINTWQHIAVCRVSGTTRLFLNGVLEATTTSSINLSANSQLNIGNQGSFSPTSYNYIGYMQDIRITKNVGRYAGNFTPPTAAFAYNQYDIGNQQWLPTNISVTAGVNQDNLVDSPSDYGTDTGLGGQVRGNYATWNPLSGVANGTLSNGNLDFVGVASGDSQRPSTVGIVSGKWYAEIRVNSALSGSVSLGVSLYSQSAIGTINGTQSRGYFYTGQKYSNGVLSNYGTSYTNGDIIGIAVDADNSKIWFSKNGVFQASGDPVAGTNAAFTDITSNTWFIVVQTGGATGGAASSVNFGQRAFSYTAPSGFKCLVSTNLPTVNGIGATSTTRADDYFNPTIWTGNGSQVDVGFNPELLWYKARNAVDFGGVIDVLRGDTKYLQTYSTNPEGTQAGLLTTNSTGFVPGTPFSTNNYVAWSWKANGAGVTNTNGSITSTISANATSGCSVVRYTGTGANATVGHGLGKQLKFLVVKELSNVDSWVVWHTAIPGTQYLIMNTEAAAATLANVWNSTVPSSSAPYVFSLGSNASVNQSGQPYVAYCFTEIPSFSSMGTFTGNNASDGPFVYTGFRPAYVLIKSTNYGNAGSTWVIKDELRAANYNPATGNLYANLDFAEDVTATVHVDLLSNGFKLRGNYVGINGPYTYMYVAFAESPFKYSRAR
jgi:hypothetical protein